MVAFRISARTASLAATCALAAASIASAPWSAALADVRDDDAVLERPAIERGLVEGELPDIEAPHAALLDEDGALWYGRGAYERVPIASLTKIMTALVAVEHLEARDDIAVTATASGVGESSAGLLEGDEMTFDDALKALLTASGNDAATAVAEAAGKDILAARGKEGDGAACVEAFVEAMNGKASELGLEDSLFTNPHGLDDGGWDEGQYGCARDVAVMLRAAMRNDLIRSNIGFSSVDIVVRRAGGQATQTLTNTDTMLRDYEGACAAKTGYTQAAGPSVATAVNRGDGHEYYAAVLGASSKEQRFEDSAALYDWLYAERGALEARMRAEKDAEREERAAEAEPARYALVRAPGTVRASIGGLKEDFPVVARVSLADWADRTVAATVAERSKTVEAAEGAPIEQHASFENVVGDVRCGDVVGRIWFEQEGRVLWEADLLAAESVDAPAWWERIGVGAQRLLALASGGETTAESELSNLGAERVS